jgi:four helix bundle protein
MNNTELLNRLIDFSVACLKLTQELPQTPMTKGLIEQLSRSCVSPALNYAEAMGAESVKDFSHKLGIAQKELREALTTLAILRSVLNSETGVKIMTLIDDCNQLISILVKSIRTTKQRFGV